jgi:hypothetical protein
VLVLVLVLVVVVVTLVVTCVVVLVLATFVLIFAIVLVMVVVVWVGGGFVGWCLVLVRTMLPASPVMLVLLMVLVMVILLKPMALRVAGVAMCHRVSCSPRYALLHQSAEIKAKVAGVKISTSHRWVDSRVDVVAELATPPPIS